VIQLVLELTDGYRCFPFNRPGQQATVILSVIKHRANDKMIAMVYTKVNQVCLDIKLTPEQNDELRLLAGVEPGLPLE